MRSILFMIDNNPKVADVNPATDSNLRKYIDFLFYQ